MESSGKVFANQRIVESRSPLVAHYAYGGQIVYFCSDQEPALREKGKSRTTGEVRVQPRWEGKRAQWEKWRGVEREWVCGIGGHGGSCRRDRRDRAGQMRVRGTTQMGGGR